MLIGGGKNHRMGLFDMVMIKDNHIAASGGIRQAIANAHNYLVRRCLLKLWSIPPCFSTETA